MDDAHLRYCCIFAKKQNNLYYDEGIVSSEVSYWGTGIGYECVSDCSTVLGKWEWGHLWTEEARDHWKRQDGNHSIDWALLIWMRIRLNLWPWLVHVACYCALKRCVLYYYIIKEDLTDKKWIFLTKLNAKYLVVSNVFQTFASRFSDGMNKLTYNQS